MTTLESVKKVIRNRPVCIMSHGNSIAELENHIEEFRDKDICWMSFSVFPIMEKYILSKIGKDLDIVFDCATVPHARIEHYELTQRVPRLEDFLSRSKDKIWITSHGIIRDCITPYYPYFLDKYYDQITLIDSFFPSNETAKYMDVPNSVCFLIASALAGGASKVIIFGLDGSRDNGVESYYKHEYHMIERKSALGDYQDAGIPRDTKGFQERVTIILERYRNLFNNKAEIFNCSPQSLYDVLPKIKYNELENILK